MATVGVVPLRLCFSVSVEGLRWKVVKRVVRVAEKAQCCREGLERNR